MAKRGSRVSLAEPFMSALGQDIPARPHDARYSPKAQALQLARPSGRSRACANELGYFFFDLHMVVGHMPLRTLQGEKSPIILRS